MINSAIHYMQLAIPGGIDVYDKEQISKNLICDETKVPEILQGEINTVCKKYSHPPPSLPNSIYYLVRDCCYGCLIIYTTILLESYINPIVLFLVYSVIMGTVMAGLWVLGNECGHGAFGRNIIENDIFGFILHSILLVPYFSWK